MNRDSLVSAALRHLRDAEHLLEVGPDSSPDQAWHLIGFAVECARKAGLPRGTFDKAIGHDLDEGLMDWLYALEVEPGSVAPFVPVDLKSWRLRAAEDALMLFITDRWTSGALKATPR